MAESAGAEIWDLSHANGHFPFVICLGGVFRMRARGPLSPWVVYAGLWLLIFRKGYSLLTSL